MNDWKRITLKDLEMLPVGHRQKIPEDYLDANAHMNVMWFTHLFSCALMEVWNAVGLTAEYFEKSHSTTFALESHVRFFHEVRVGQQVTVRTRAIVRAVGQTIPNAAFHVERRRGHAGRHDGGDRYARRLQHSAIVPLSSAHRGSLRSASGRAFQAVLAGPALRRNARLVPHVSR